MGGDRFGIKRPKGKGITIRHVQALIRLHASDPCTESKEKSRGAVYVRSLRRPQRRWGNFVSPFKEFEEINATAWWDYQRDRIYVKSPEFVKQKTRHDTTGHAGWQNRLPVRKVIVCPEQGSCPFCGEACNAVCRRNRTLYDLSLLSICQTCKCSGLDFFDFLRSGERDLHAFAEHRRRRPPATLLTGLPVEQRSAIRGIPG